jgi:hypothetical protein
LPTHARDCVTRSITASQPVGRHAADLVLQATIPSQGDCPYSRRQSASENSQNQTKRSEFRSIRRSFGQRCRGCWRHKELLLKRYDLAPPVPGAEAIRWGNADEAECGVELVCNAGSWGIDFFHYHDVDGRSARAHLRHPVIRVPPFVQTRPWEQDASNLPAWLESNELKLGVVLDRRTTHGLRILDDERCLPGAVVHATKV